MNELTQFDSLAAEIAVFVKPGMEVVVTSKESCDAALLSVQQVKRLAKAVEERRKEVTKPLLEQKKNIDDYVKKLMAPLEKVEASLKTTLIAWERKLEQERREAQRKLEEQAAKERKAHQEKMRAEEERLALEKLQAEMLGSDEPENTFEKEKQEAELERQKYEVEKKIEADKRMVAEHRVTGTQKVWSFVVESPSEVPNEYKIVDERLIRAAVRGGIREIPGVRIFEETKISVRS